MTNPTLTLDKARQILNDYPNPDGHTKTEDDESIRFTDPKGNYGLEITDGQPYFYTWYDETDESHPFVKYINDLGYGVDIY